MLAVEIRNSVWICTTSATSRSPFSNFQKTFNKISSSLDYDMNRLYYQKEYHKYRYIRSGYSSDD